MVAKRSRSAGPAKWGSPLSQIAVARRAGVARSTVSMALNGDPRINAKTRAKNVIQVFLFGAVVFAFSNLF